MAYESTSFEAIEPLSASEGSTSELDLLATQTNGSDWTLLSASSLYGYIELLETGNVNYQVPYDIAGNDSITFWAIDGQGNIAVQTVQVNIEQVNNAPVTNLDYLETQNGNPITLNVYEHLLSNDYDPDGDDIQYVAGSLTAELGSIVEFENGDFTYTPPVDGIGNDTLFYYVTDGIVSSPVEGKATMSLGGSELIGSHDVSGNGSVDLVVSDAGSQLELQFSSEVTHVFQIIDGKHHVYELDGDLQQFFITKNWGMGSETYGVVIGDGLHFVTANYNESLIGFDTTGLALENSFANIVSPIEFVLFKTRWDTDTRLTNNAARINPGYTAGDLIALNENNLAEYNGETVSWSMNNGILALYKNDVTVETRTVTFEELEADGLLSPEYVSEHILAGGQAADSLVIEYSEPLIELTITDNLDTYFEVEESIVINFSFVEIEGTGALPAYLPTGVISLAKPQDTYRLYIKSLLPQISFDSWLGDYVIPVIETIDGSDQIVSHDAVFDNDNTGLYYDTTDTAITFNWQITDGNLELITDAGDMYRYTRFYGDDEVAEVIVEVSLASGSSYHFAKYLVRNAAVSDTQISDAVQNQTLMGGAAQFNSLRYLIDERRIDPENIFAFTLYNEQAGLSDSSVLAAERHVGSNVTDWTWQFGSGVINLRAYYSMTEGYNHVCEVSAPECYYSMIRDLEVINIQGDLIWVRETQDFIDTTNVINPGDDAVYQRVIQPRIGVYQIPPVLQVPTIADESVGKNTVLEIDPYFDVKDSLGGTTTTYLVNGRAENGSLALTDAGNIEYTPNTDFIGDDIVTYTLTDAYGGFSVIEKLITVFDTNEIPTASDDAVSIDEDSSLELALNSVDSDGSIVAFHISSSTSNGSVVIEGSRAIYTPNADFNGTDSFTYQAEDDSGAYSNVATVTITINPVNDAPVATDATYNVSEGGDVSLVHADFMFDAETSAEGLGYTIVSAPTYGTLTDNSDGTFTYVHDGSEAMTDTIEFQLFDGSAYSVSNALVTISIAGINDAPTITSSATAQLNEHSSDTFTAFATDPEGDTLTWSLEDPNNIFTIDSSSGQVSIVDAVSWDYETLSPYEITITAVDQWGEPDTLNVLVSPIDIPEAPKISANVTLSLNENHSGAAGLFVTADDPENDAYTASLVDDVGALLGTPDVFSFTEVSTGNFSLQVSGTLDFEALNTDFSSYDEDGDSTNNEFQYKVKLKVEQNDDATLFTEQELLITITDQVENTELSLDTTFGDNGVLSFNPYSDMDNSETFIDAKRDSSGNVYALIDASTDGYTKIVIAKYLATGDYDTAFGYLGRKHIFANYQKDPYVELFDDAPQALNPTKIIIDDEVGSAQYGKIYVLGGQVNSGSSNPADEPFVIRLGSDGHLDTTFDNDGKLTVNAAAGAEGVDLLMHSDGNLYLLSNVISSYELSNKTTFLSKINLTSGGVLSNMVVDPNVDFDTDSSTGDVYSNALFENTSNQLVVIGHADTDGTFDIYGALINTSSDDDAVVGFFASATNYDIMNVTIGDGPSDDIINSAIQIDAATAYIAGTTDYLSGSSYDGMLLKIDLDTLALFGDSDTECTTNSICFGNLDENSDTVPDGVTIYDLEGGVNDEIISIAINGDEDIVTLSKASDTISNPDVIKLSLNQFDKTGFETANAAALTSEELSKQHLSVTSSSSDLRAHGVVLQDGADPNSAIFVVNSKEVDNNGSTELETWFTQFTNAGSSDLDNNGQEYDLAIIRDHNSSPTYSNSVSYDASSSQFISFMATWHSAGYGFDIMAFDGTTGSWNQAFNSSETVITKLPDVTNGTSQYLSDNIVLSDGSTVFVSVEKSSSSSTISVSKVDGSGNLNNVVSYTKTTPNMYVNKIIEDSSNQRLYLVGEDDEFSEGSAKPLLVAIDTSSWNVVADLNIDIFTDSSAAFANDVTMLSDGSVVIVGQPSYGNSTMDMAFAVKLVEDSSASFSGDTTSILGSNTGSFEVDTSFSNNQTGSNVALLMDFSLNNELNAMTNIVALSDDSMIIALFDEYAYESRLFKLNSDGSRDTTFNQNTSELILNMSDISSSGTTGQTLVGDMVVDNDTLWISGKAGFGEFERPFVAKLTASTGVIDSTFGQNSVPGFFVPYARAACTSTLDELPGICSVMNFEKIWVDGSGNIYVSGTGIGGSSSFDGVIIKFSETQDDLASPYVILDGVIQEGA